MAELGVSPSRHALRAPLLLLEQAQRDREEIGTLQEPTVTEE